MGLVVGPMNHYWYKWLDARIIRGSQGAIVLKKVFADICASPVFASTFISGVALLEGQSISGALNEYGRKFFRILMETMLSDNFTLGVALLEGQSISGALNEYGRKFFRILMVNDLFHFYGDIWSLDCCVWPPTQTFNFWLLPSSCRVLYVSTVQLVYNCFLSYIKHNEADGTPTVLQGV
uniref:Mpv17-like protein n=1 Tax=Ascaris lumbricoides TaxID=6252 RepID=A0A0M3IQI7_ASCLU